MTISNPLDAEQVPTHRIAVYILQLLNPLCFRMNIEIVVSWQPKRPLRRLLRHRRFQGLYRNIESRSLRLAHKQMHMLRHHNVAVNAQYIPPPNLFQRPLKGISRISHCQVWHSIVTTECNEMQVSWLLETLQVIGHSGRSLHPVRFPEPRPKFLRLAHFQAPHTVAQCRFPGVSCPP